MSREIKFRVWRAPDEFSKKSWMETWNSLLNYSMSDIFQLDNPDDVLEQFTGLKDINDQDAYEGDIVSLDPDEPPYQIIFAEGKFEIVGNGINYDLGEEFMDCEVIGNIHNNPELLEEK